MGQALAFLESLRRRAAALVFLQGSGLFLTLGIFIPRFFQVQADLAEEAFLLSRSNLVFSALQKGWSDWREYESLEQENTSLKREIGKLTDEMKHLSEVLKDHEKICPLLHCTMNFVTVPRPDALSSCLPR